MDDNRLQRIEEVFSVIDLDGSGEITSHEMLDFARTYADDPSYSEARCRRLVDRIDTDQDGAVSKAEFIAFFTELSKGITDDDAFNAGIEKYIDAGKALRAKQTEAGGDVARDNDDPALVRNEDLVVISAVRSDGGQSSVVEQTCQLVIENKLEVEKRERVSVSSLRNDGSVSVHTVEKVETRSVAYHCAPEAKQMIAELAYIENHSGEKEDLYADFEEVESTVATEAEVQAAGARNNDQDHNDEVKVQQQRYETRLEELQGELAAGQARLAAQDAAREAAARQSEKLQQELKEAAVIREEEVKKVRSEGEKHLALLEEQATAEANELEAQRIHAEEQARTAERQLHQVSAGLPPLLEIIGSTGRRTGKASVFGVRRGEVEVQQQVEAVRRAQEAEQQVPAKAGALGLGEEVANSLVQLQEQCADMRARHAEERAARKALQEQVHALRGSIRVIARVRPLLPFERECGDSDEQQPYSIPTERTLELCPPADAKNAKKNKLFAFDSVFGPDSAQADVFEQVEGLVASVADGYNACIFAYGQTGAGKTYTMQGRGIPALSAAEAEVDPFLDRDTDAGLSIRAIGALFRQIGAAADTHDFEVGVGLVEVYKEAIRDLLHGAHAELGEDLMSPSALGAEQNEGLERGEKASSIKHQKEEREPAPECKVRVHRSKDVELEGMSEMHVRRAAQVLQLLRLGQSRRAVSATAMNAESSRSHLALFVRVRATERASGRVTSSKLCLCDLAGSERVGKSQATGQQLKEAQGINQSLSALGNVMQSLQSKSTHIPYRNSKLTHMLSDMLGGKAKVATIVQISPAVSNLAESSCTLQFGERVGQVSLGETKKAVVARAVSASSPQSHKVHALEESVKAAEAEAEGLRSELKLQAAKRQQTDMAQQEGGALLALRVRMQKQAREHQQEIARLRRMLRDNKVRKPIKASDVKLKREQLHQQLTQQGQASSSSLGTSSPLTSNASNVDASGAAALRVRAHRRAESARRAVARQREQERKSTEKRSLQKERQERAQKVRKKQLSKRSVALLKEQERAMRP